MVGVAIRCVRLRNSCNLSVYFINLVGLAIVRLGSWYSYNEDRIGQGRENAKSWLEENPGAAAELERAILVMEGFEVEGDGALALSVPRRVERVHDERTVLLVTSDTHRGDHLGFLGAVDVDTVWARLVAEDLVVPPRA